MNNPNVSLLRSPLVLCSLAFAFTEWILFELLRMPYRPPVDMLTFLGRQEKHAVMAAMGVALITWLLAVVRMGSTSKATYRERVATMVVVLLLATALGVAVVFPLWAVTPVKYLFH
jgi:hypothetical protein